MTELQGEKIVVIGGTSALGKQFLKAARSQGADCAVLGRHAPSSDDKVPFFRADITSLVELTAAANQAVAAFGGIDTVINFAGTHHQPMDFYKEDHSELLREYQRVMDVNLTGAFLATMVFGKHMIARRHGHIVHLCSNASRLSLYGSYAYNMSKHALEGLIKTAAAQLAHFGVRVNGVAPGTVETPLNRNLLRLGPEGSYSPRAASILAHTPTKRFASVEGVAETLCAVCIPQRHLTGNVIFCDDGYNVEGHSWPEGTAALYAGPDKLADLFSSLGPEYPNEN